MGAIHLYADFNPRVTTNRLVHIMNHRATIALALATLACFAVLSFNNGENSLAKESITSDTFDASLVQVAGPGDASVVKAIVDLKAYCMGARKKAIKMKNGGKTSSLVPFSFSAGKKSHGNGCLKMKCGKNAWSERGFGRKTHDYYMKYSSYWAKVVKKREMAAKEKKKKEMSKKEKAKKERSKKAEMKHKEREQKARERAAKAAARKERSTKAAQRAKEINDKEKASKERAAKEKPAKAAERNSKESSAKYERSSKESAYKARFLPPGSCCWFLYGCARCCDKCPGGNHWVGPGTCGTSRKCNRL